MTEITMAPRLAGVRITRTLAKAITQRTTGIPDGAQLVDGFTDPWTRDVVLIFEHETFPAHREGDSVPMLDLKLDDPSKPL